MALSTNAAQALPRAETVRKPRFWRLTSAAKRVARSLGRLLRESFARTICLDLLLGVLAAGLALALDLDIGAVKSAKHDDRQRQYDAFDAHCRQRGERAACENDLAVTTSSASFLPEERTAFDVWTCACRQPGASE